MSPTDHLLWAVTEIPGCNSICQTRALGLWWGSPPKELVQITCLSTLIDRFASTMSASSMLQFQVHIGSFTSILSLSNSNFILMPDWNLSSFSLFLALLVELWAVLATRQLMLYLGLSVPAEFCWWVTSLHWTEYVWSSCGQCLKGHQVCERWTEPDYQWCTNFTGSRAPVQISMGLSCTSSIWKMTDALLQTGTPVQNDLNEFYAMIDFANPSLLGPLAAFKRLYADPIQRSRDRDARWDFHLESIQETFPLCLYVVNLPASCVLFAWVWEGDLSEGSVFKVYLKHHFERVLWCTSEGTTLWCALQWRGARSGPCKVPGAADKNSLLHTAEDSRHQQEIPANQIRVHFTMWKLVLELTASIFIVLGCRHSQYTNCSSSYLQHGNP